MSLAMRVAYFAYKFFENALLRKSKLVVTTSQEYLSASKPLRPWRSKCQVIPLGIDVERMIKPTVDQVKQSKDLWPRSSETRFLAVGRLAYYKGYDSLIRAIAETTEGSLVIVGDGEMKAALLQLISTLRVDDRVTLVGALSSHELSACYAAADVFFMTSTDRSEAFGVALLEAAHYGCRIVALEIPGSGVGAVTRALGGVTPALSSGLLALRPMLSNGPSYRRFKCSPLPKKFLLTSHTFDVLTNCYERAVVCDA
jgi:glycosyltransferase involved in cell wall biosynthesis